MKNLLELTRVDHRVRHRCREVELDRDRARLEFGVQKLKGVVQDLVEVVALALRNGRADGAEELLEDRVEPADFIAGGGEAALEGLTLFLRQLTQLSVDQLQVNADRVERVADFVGNARGQQRERVVAFGLEDFLSLGTGAGEVAE